MLKNLQYKKILLACLLIFVSFVALNKIDSRKSVSFDLAELPENYIVLEGYIVSKRINSIWLADEPINFIKSTGATNIHVFKSKDFKDNIHFKQFKLNQKVRVYSDYIRESNPPKTEAFYLEIIENDDN